MEAGLGLNAAMLRFCEELNQSTPTSAKNSNLQTRDSVA